MANNAKTPIRIHKRLLQFNSLPFAFGEITEQSYTSTFKGSTQSYTNNAHGGYYPNLGEFGKLETSEFQATISLSIKDIACEDRVRYFRFAKRQLAQSGKLWAIQNGTELIWTHARVVSINEVVDDVYATDELVLSVTFELIDGYWVIASKTRTFLCNYCAGRFQDFDPYYCWDVNDLAGRCDATGSAACYPCLNNLYQPVEIQTCNWEPLCHYPAVNPVGISKNNQLVDTIPSLMNLFSAACPNEMAIKYSCELEKEKFCNDASWGSKYRLRSDEVNNTTEISFCSKTDLPTTLVRLRLLGKFSNPSITVNGDKVQIGDGNNPFVDRKGIITVGYGTRVYYTNSTKDPELNTTDLNLITTRDNTPMFEITPGMNTIQVSGNVYNESAFVYIQPVEITY